MMAFQATAQGGRRTLSRSSLTKVSAVKELPPCEQWLNSEVSSGDKPVEAVVSHPEPPSYWRPDQRNCEPAQWRAAAKQSRRRLSEAQSGLLRRCAPSQ